MVRWRSDVRSSAGQVCGPRVVTWSYTCLDVEQPVGHMGSHGDHMAVTCGGPMTVTWRSRGGSRGGHVAATCLDVEHPAALLARERAELAEAEGEEAAGEEDGRA
eukprot:6791411-Prymnesium_polylepis.1